MPKYNILELKIRGVIVSDYNYREYSYDLYVVYSYKLLYKLTVEKDRHSIFTTVTTILKPGF